MKKTAVIIMLLTIFSKLLGFSRALILSYFYGTSSISDAYLIARTIPVTIFAFIGAGIATSYIPLYSNIESKNNQKVADKFTNNLTNFILLLCTILIIFGQTFTSGIVKVFASGFEGETLKLAITFTRISFFGIYFTGLIYIFSGYLRLKNKFIIPAITGIPLNLITIVSIALSSKFSLLILVIGSVLAIMAQLMLLIPFVYKKGFRYKPILDASDPNAKRMLYLSLPVVLGTSVNQINQLVDRTIASRISIGGIYALTYAHRLDRFIQGIFVMSLATVMYPIISKMAAENNIKAFKKNILESINAINLLVTPATVGAMIFAKPIVTLLFGRGAFDSKAISMTSHALFFYSIGMVGFGLRQILSRAFYSLKDTKTPMINGAIAMVINIILNIILSRYLGIGGLALATSISAMACTGLLFISLRSKIGKLGLKRITITFLKIITASSLMGLLAKLSFEYLKGNIFSLNVSLIMAITIGILSYFTIICFMKIDDVDVIVRAVKKKFKLT